MLSFPKVVFVNKNKNDVFQSFSMPFFCLRNLDIEQPVFGANYIKGEVRSEPQGRWEGTAKLKIWFNNGGAIEFGQCLLNAGRLASEARVAQQYVQTQAFNGNIYPAPPPAYSTLSSNNYGWVPLERFPDRPQGENVYMFDQPPPYAGIFPQPQTHSFDEKTRVGSTATTNGYVNSNDPNKMYVVSTASAPPPDELPPSYTESTANKKNE